MYLTSRKLITLVLCLLILTNSINSSLSLVPINATIENQVLVLTAPLEFEEKYYREWHSIGQLLINSNYKIYKINWRGFGGLVSMGKAFIKNLEQAKAQGKIIIFNLIGPSFSMHATVPCYASKIENPSNTYLMFHADGYSYKNVSYRLNKDTTNLTAELNYCIQASVLKFNEVNTMWNGYEVYKNNATTWYRPDTRPRG